MTEHFDNHEIILDAPNATSKPRWRYALYWGMIGAAGLAFFDFLVYVLWHYIGPSWLPSKLYFLTVFVVVLYMSMKTYRDKEQGGKIALDKSIGLGVRTTMILMVFFAIWSLLLVTTIAPNLLQDINNQFETMIIAQKLPKIDESYALYFSRLESVPWVYTLSLSLISLFTGFFASLFCAGVAANN